jgi:hypothetical protein
MLSRLINIILFLIVIYFIMTHDKDERFSDYYKPIKTNYNSNYNSKNKKKNLNNKNVVPKNSKEDLHLSAPINKKSALENIMKNENPFVAKYYQDDSDIPKTEEEEEILNSIIEEFQDGTTIVENFEDIDYKENIDKFKEANKCASHLLPYKEEKENDEGLEIHKSLNKKFHDLLKNKKHPVDIIKCDPSRLDNWKMYKKVEERISEKLDENDEPKTLNQVYNESIIDFKKINPKLNKNEEERIQGKYKPTTNIGSSFSFFTNDNNEVNDLMANESQFEFNSTV